MLINTIHCIVQRLAIISTIYSWLVVGSTLIYMSVFKAKLFGLFFLFLSQQTCLFEFNIHRKFENSLHVQRQKKTTTVTFPFQNSLSNYSTHLAWVTVADYSPGLKFCSCRLLTLSYGYEYILRATYQEFCTSIGQLVSTVMLLLFKSKPLKSGIHIQQLTPLSAQLLHLFH